MVVIEEKHLGQLWDNFAFTKLFRSFRMAVAPSKLVVALIAVVVICAIGWVMDICSSTVAIQRQEKASNGVTVSKLTELDVFITEPDKRDEFLQRYGEDGGQGVFATLWHFCAKRFNIAIVPLLKLDTSNIFANISNVFVNIGLCVKAFLWAMRYHTLYTFIFITLAFPVICIAGGTICRSAVLEFARGEKAGMGEAVRFSISKFRSFLSAPLVPVAVIICFLAVIAGIGSLGNVPWVGGILIGLGLPGALFFGLLTVLMVAGAVGGGGIMFPAIAYEGSTGFDAISRSYMYVFTQPLWMIVYAFIATVYGTLSYLLVRFFTFMLLLVTYIFLDAGLFNGPEQQSNLSNIWSKPEFINLMGSGETAASGWSESVSGFLVNIWVMIAVGLVVAFVISFYFSVNTIIYSLLRNRVDGTGVDEVYLQLNEIEDISS